MSQVSASVEEGRSFSPSGVTTNTLVSAIEDNVCSVILGKKDTVRLTVAALLAGGHVLIEDAPGVGKTALAKAIARSLACKFARLQFTPDLLPSDIVGTSVYLPATGTFEFREGPVFTNVLLADEINRTTPRTQSALLEAMSERQVSVDGRTLQLTEPFFVVATQNPFEFEGTYELPENQLDRFMLCVEVGYPDREREREVLVSHREGEPVDSLEPVITRDQLLDLQAATRSVRVEDSINDYILDIVDATRNHDELALGVSTRGALTLYRAAQGLAMVNARDFVVPDDVKQLVRPVIAHRVLCKGFVQQGRRRIAVEILDRVLAEIPVPS